MLELNKELQQSLLDLANLDLEISRVNHKLAKLSAGEAAEKLRTNLIAIGDDLLSAHAKVTNLEQQLSKTLDDVTLVSARIKHDEARSKELSSDRDIRAINHELDSLRIRLSTLEDSELELMDLVEKAKADADTLTQNRTKAALELEQELKSQDAAAVELTKTKTDLQTKRDRTVALLPVEVVSSFERKSARGVAVGQLDGRDCTACRFAVNGVAYDSLMSEPENKLVTCPNCDAFLVR
jgi:predicted  nucleic acid-binding Zn-ribbon protein